MPAAPHLHGLAVTSSKRSIPLQRRSVHRTLFVASVIAASAGCGGQPGEAVEQTTGSAAAITSGDYTFVSAYTGKAVEVYGWSQDDGARVSQWDITGGANQGWTVQAVAGGAYNLINKNSGKCMDILGWNGADGASVGQYTCNGKDNQKWKITSSSGHYQVTSAWNGKCLDVLGWDTSNGANVGVWTCKGAENQLYAITRVGGNVPPPPPPETGPAQKVISFLQATSGSKTVSGQHNREPNSNPSEWTDAIHNTTGKYPALWGGDFLFESDNIANRPLMIAEAKKQWSQGAIVNLMYHACPPTQGEACDWNGGVLSNLSDSQWNELVTDGTGLNNTWKSRLDNIAVYLQDLKDSGVAALFRPMHEMNQGAFWWGGRPGANGTRKLYQITHDYLVNTKGLDNLVWIWSVQDLDLNFADYNPGASYFDVAALDMYGNGYTMDKYNTMVSVAGGKPIAIGECQQLPAAWELAQQPRWAFFMAWAELVYNNSTQSIQDLYSAPNVLTLGGMPGWK